MVNFIRNLQIRLKLYILVGIALFGLLLVGGMSLLLISELNSRASNLALDWLPSIDGAREMSAAVANVRLNELECVISASGNTQTNQERIAAGKKELDEVLSSYAGVVDAGEAGYYDNAVSLWAQYQKTGDEMLKLAQAGSTEEAYAIFAGESEKLYQSLVVAFEELVTYNTNGSNEEIRSGMGFYKTAVTLMVVVSLVVIAVGIYFSFIIIRLIKLPISEIEEAAFRMAKGDLEAEISYNSKDELGVLSEQMRSLIRKLKAIVNDENVFLAKMAEGDLTVDSICEEEYTGSFQPVLTSFRGIAERLNSTMLQINQSSAQVASGSDQVSSGAQALSQGATEQASSVEELAATINDISGKVNENAKNARQADSMAGVVSNEMNTSNEKMQHMIQAMNDISGCSNEIGKIIKTIEDIAFQTNILALNAAVEAARAGSAGKGFAVVADEVRNLASKSAEASQNTSALIENSLKAVENGTQIAAETAQSLLHAVDRVKEMADTIGQISEASDNQAAAISQVTMGIDQISSVVQTNSATAQQSAAASEELSSQSQIMKTLVGRFKLKG